MIGINNKLLVYSGTYNPIHNGHLQIAKKAKDILSCEKVVLIPASKPYHKSNEWLATFDDRIEMAKLAAKGLEGFEVSTIDKEANPENSYSFNTIKKLVENLGIDINQGKINFLIGTDAFENLNKWFKANELAKLVDFIVVTRPKSENIDKTVSELKKSIPDLTFEVIKNACDISSTAIRNGIKTGTDILTSIPKNVYDYIMNKNLYK